MSIKAGQQVKISIDPRDAFGNKARVENTLWQLNDASLGALDVSSDGVSVIFSSIGKVGEAVIEVAADADLSEGIRNIAGAVTIAIEPGEAVDLGVFAEPIVVEVAPVAAAPEAVVEEPVAEEAAEVEVAPVVESEAVAEEPAAELEEAVEPAAEPEVVAEEPAAEPEVAAEEPENK